MKMKMMLLLVSAAFLLGSPSTAGPVHHESNEILERVFDLASSYNRSLTRQKVVEDVTHLAEGKNKCQDKFFCKVNDLLRANLRKGRKEKLVRTLQIYINDTIPNCTELQRNMTSTGIFKPLSKVLENLTKCVRSRNFKRKKSVP